MNIAILKDLSILLNLLGMGNYFILSLLYLRTGKKIQLEQGLLLASLMFVLGITTFNTVLNETSYGELLPLYEPLSNALGYTIGPLLFLSISAMEKNNEKQNYLPHFMPFFIVLVMTILSAWPLNYLVINDAANLLISGTRHFMIWNLHLGTYILLSYRIISKNIQSHRNKLGFILFWGIATVWFINFILFLGAQAYPSLGGLVRLNVTILLFLLSLIIFFNLQFFPISIKNLQPRLTPEENRNISQKRLFGILINKIRAHNLHTDPNANIRSISKELDIPYHEFSRMINEETQNNFNQFINELRIEDVIAHLKSNAHKELTILGLAQQCGFRSASSFYAAFKKATGTTPTSYVKQIV